MAEPGSSSTSGAAGFEVRGAVIVDQAALKKSLGTAQQTVESWATNIERIVGERADPGKILARGGGPGGRGPGGAPHDPLQPVRHSAHSTGSQFSHLARIIREVLAGPLAALSPELGRFVGASAAAARSARFYGAAIGAAIVGAVVFTEVLGKYFEQANKATEATVEASQALATLDFDRSSASVKKASDELAKYNVQLQQVGNDQYTVWQQIAARIAITQDAITGGTKQMVANMAEEAKNQANVLIPLVEIPKALAEAEKKAADIASKRAQMAIAEASSTEEIGKAYDAAAAAVQRKTKADLEELRIKELKEGREGQTVVDNAATAGATLEQIAQLQIAHNKKMAKFAIERKTLLDQESFEAFKSADEKKKALAQAAADAEDAAQKDIERNLKRVQDTARSAEAIAQAENQIAEIQRKRAGVVESVGQLEDRLAASREHATEPIVAGIQAATDKYQSQRRALEELIAAGKDVYKNTIKLTELEKSSAEEIGGLKRKLAEEEASQNAKAAQAREERNQKEIASEEKKFAHLVTMGRATMQSEIAFQEAAARDPRRSADQQAEAEEKLLAKKKEYADQYFRYYQSLGANTFQQELQFATNMLSQTVEGSKSWFEQVDKIAKLYERIHNEAKGIVSQVGGAAEAEAKRHGKMIKNAQDLAYWAARAEQGDTDVLRGGGKKPGQFLQAVGRVDTWRQAQQFGGVGAALDVALANPQAQLANTIASTATRPDIYGQVQDQMAGQRAAADAARDAADAMALLADAARVAAGALGGVGSGGDADKSSSSAPTRVLETAQGRMYTNVPPNVDSAMGRALLLASKRGLNATETFP